VTKADVTNPCTLFIGEFFKSTSKTILKNRQTRFPAHRQIAALNKECQRKWMGATLLYTVLLLFYFQFPGLTNTTYRKLQISAEVFQKKEAKKCGMVMNNQS
jgi:hypothetical protein